MISIVPRPANARAARYRQSLVSADDLGSRRRRAIPGADKPPRSQHSSPSTTSAWSSAAFILRGMRGFTNDAVKDGSPALSRGPQFSDYESGGQEFESLRADQAECERFEVRYSWQKATLLSV